MLKLLRLLAWTLISTATAIVLLGGAAYWLYNDAQAPGPLGEAKTLVVPAHSGVPAIADLLAKEGVVRNKLTFDVMAEIMAKATGRGHALKPGEYEFPAAATTFQVIEIIAGGHTVKHRLTIPEGLTSAEVMALVAAAPVLDGDAGPIPAEGTLLPDTYLYSYGDSRKGIVARMERAMTQIVAEIWAERRPDYPLGAAQDVVTLASIVEKETARPEERPHVAGVYLNRLRLGMRLQADPTVLFALEDNGAKKFDRPLTHADLSFNSPYNTYLVKGLPPGPIANPSRQSLRAAVRPERTEDLYFVADGTGGHVFAKTLADQTRNIAQYQHGAPPSAPEMLPPLDPLVDPAGQPSAAQPPPAAARPEPDKAHRIVARTGSAPSGKRTAEQTARLRRCHDTGRDCPAGLH